MKKILLIIVIVLLVLFLSSCESDKIEGVVVEKCYEPPTTYTTIVPMIVNGNTIMIPQISHRSARYMLKLSRTLDDGTDITITVSVSLEEYNDIEIGDYYKNYKEDNK